MLLNDTFPPEGRVFAESDWIPGSDDWKLVRETLMIRSDAARLSKVRSIGFQLFDRPARYTFRAKTIDGGYSW